ncbi:tRNA pseudouridine(38-40) synthase TruA [Rhodopseudomonas palustris]|uniref:tRNA pseudouridine synthase A n=1 Tax=Thiospirillum jenense TaxID=1653858 RepID=A0A839HGM6_9GAMM|nr:tRNA pseudouridine(38-40) synthase TruA [Rhodopseudomonas palustris]MBB1127140.1 tRNA pseudouridine(38-40) synthase TruA [Thiospirillum jenense]
MGVEYDGSDFAGWQLQHHAVTVQGCLEAAVSQVAAQPVRLHCAGRTDAGVHALGQVAHFETTAERPPRAWLLGINSHLPPTVSVTWVKPVAAEFHARFSAIARHYRYLIVTRPTRSALMHQRAVWTHHRLDVTAMAQAAQALVGQHDFSSFRAMQCQAKSPVRTVHALTIQQRGDFITLDISADGFLHHQVRNIAGVLMAIGRHERAVEWTAQLLTLRDRRQGGVTAPPHGLYLMRVDYPTQFQINIENEQCTLNNYSVFTG